MAHNVVCKNADMAVKIIETVAKSMKQGTQRDALTAAAEWLRANIHDIPDTHEERVALANKLHQEFYQSAETEDLWAELHLRGEIKTMPAGRGKRIKHSAGRAI